MRKRVAIIGAGPCGLSQMRAFQQAQQKGETIPEIVCFEKQKEWGGLWNFTWRIGVDEYGEPQHGSMYRYLWSNGPKECLEFADYPFDEHFGKPIPSFPPREVLYDYIIGRIEKSNVKSWVRFSTVARHITHSESSGKFKVTVEHLPENRHYTEEFDHVVVSIGHFSVPHVPYFEGIEKFPGTVIHGHDFREARQFSGQKILVVGGSYSAEDIALQCHKYGAESVTISYRTAAMGFKWPEGIEELPLISRFEDHTVHFKEGSSRKIDAVILCTGYLHSFPFMDENLKLKTTNLLYPPDLYKGIFWVKNPNLMYLGMQDQYYTFSMFDAQAWYARDMILGRLTLPSQTEMAEDIAQWRAREEKVETPLQGIDFQTEYTRDLLKEIDYPAFDLDAAAQAFKEWEHHKETNILTYRDNAFKSPCTGTMATIHHTTWMEAMDDSMKTFMDES